MSFYTDAAADAKELLKEFGQIATWQRHNNDGTFNPATGATTGGTTTSYSGKGALFDFDTKMIDGAAVLRSDKQFLMEVGNKPEVSDNLTINGIIYQLIRVSELNPAGTPILYELHLRA